MTNDIYSVQVMLAGARSQANAIMYLCSQFEDTGGALVLRNANTTIGDPRVRYTAIMMPWHIIQSCTAMKLPQTAEHTGNLGHGGAK